MKKVVDSLYFDFYRQKQLQLLFGDNTPTSKMVLARLDKILKNYNKDKWKPLEEYYNEFIYLYGFYDSLALDNIVLIILLDSFEERFINKSKSVIALLIEVFVSSNLSPYRYEEYLELFLQDDIYTILLGAIDNQFNLLPLVAIIKNFELEYLKGRNSIELRSLLERLFVKKSLFYDNYSLFNICSRIKMEMDKINEKNIEFYPKDFKIIANLLNNLDLNNTELQQELVTKLQEEENFFSIRPVETLSKMLFYINEFLNKKVQVRNLKK